MSLTPAPALARRYQFPLASADIGIAQTVLLMERLISTGAKDPEVREHAQGIVAGVAPGDRHGQIAAVFGWMKSNFRFHPDDAPKEQVGDVHYLLQTRTGDCDDYVVVLGALLEALGIRTRIVTIAADKKEPTRFSHTYLQAEISPQRWIPLDASQQHAPPGWEPPYYFRKREWGAMMTRFRNRRLRWESREAGRTARGLGFDWSQFLPGIIQTGESIGQAAAARLAYGTLPPYLYGSVPGPVGAPAGAGYAGIQSTPGGVVAYGATGAGGIPTLFWVAGGFLLVLLLTRK